MDRYSEHLRTAITSVASEEGMAWLDVSCDKLKQSQDIENDLCTCSAMALRKLGDNLLNDRTEVLNTPHGELQIASWNAGNAARIILLLEAIHMQPDQSTALINAVFRYGDEIERAIITRALVLFPDPASLKSIALEAGRINSLFLYTALTEHNPYSAAFYSEHEFNHLVMKSLFMGVNIETIYGLQHRANPELSRMCEAYIDERLDAKRSVPADIWLAAIPFISEHGKEQMNQLGKNDPLHAHYISIAT